MGAYYKVVCDAMRESIDPGDINDSGVKRGAIAFPTHPFGPVVIFAMLDRWHGCGVRVVSDESDDVAYDNYVDVTESVIGEYVREYGSKARATTLIAEPIRYTGAGKETGT